MRKVYFTQARAQAAIPELTRLIARLRRLHGAIRFLNSLEVTHNDDLDDFYASVSVNHDFHKLSARFYILLRQMITKGYLLKDLDKGLIDLYAKHEGKDIFICWKMGEKHVRYWHSTTTGYDERKPLSFLGPRSSERTP